MVKKKGKSKRTTLKDKYKIQKRTVQTHRKLRKQAKKDAANGVVQKKKKDPGIPNSWPFKAELLQEVRREKERQQDLQNHRKEERAERLRELREHQRTGGTARTVEELAAAAARRRAEYESQQEAVRGAAAESEEAGSSANADDGRRRLGQSSRRAYLRQLKQLVDRSDVLLQVLDARDPVGTRLGRAMEDAILSHSDKRMVLVLNKIDLVPREVVGAWLSHLRRSHPTIALQANKVVPSGKGSGGTNRRNDRSMDGSDSAGGDEAMSVATGASTGTASSSLTPGMDGLLQLLKNYARTSGGGKNSKTTIVVGVVGYPNTGKSSILRSLTHCRGSRQAIGVSSRPGFTTTLQEVVLDRQVRLLDSPGVVFDDDNALLGNCVDADSMPDPVGAVEALLKRCTLKSLLLTYSLPNFVPGNVDMFLALMAKRQGRVTKGGIPDKASAARSVLKDWNTGKIPFYTAPPSPTKDAGGDDGGSTAVVVSQLGEDFLRKLDEQVLSGLPDDSQRDLDAMDYLELQPADGGAKDSSARFLDDDDDEEDVDEDEESDSDMDEDPSPSHQRLQEAPDYDFDEMV